MSEGTLANVKDHETVKRTALNTGKPVSQCVDKVSNELEKMTVHPCENEKLSAVKSGHNCSISKDLKILHFCVDDNKMFAICHTKKTLENSKTISLHVFDLAWGTLALVHPLYEHDIQFVDMCMSKLENCQCIAFAYTETLPSVADRWYICFMQLAGEYRCRAITLERSSLGPICSFDNTLLSYHPECHDILVFDTSKWPIKENDQAFDIGLDFDILVTDLTTCSGKEPNKRLIMLEYLAEKGNGILCLDLKGNKLWEIAPSSDPYPMYYPRGDDKGHIFLMDHSCQAILVRKDELTTELLLKIPGGIVDYHWSNTMKKLVVLHYDKKRESLLVSCYEIVEQ